MARLYLDFIATTRRPPLLAWMLLLIGALALGSVADRYADLAGNSERLADRIEKLQRRVKSAEPGQRRAETAAKEDGQRKENQLLRQLDDPWQKRLKAVEDAVDQTVALLDFDSDFPTGKIRIAAEAKTIDFALAFIARLRATGQFDDVTLVSHEARKSSGIDVIGFSLMLSAQKK